MILISIFTTQRHFRKVKESKKSQNKSHAPHFFGAICPSASSYFTKTERNKMYDFTLRSFLISLVQGMLKEIQLQQQQYQQEAQPWQQQQNGYQSPHAFDQFQLHHFPQLQKILLQEKTEKPTQGKIYFQSQLETQQRPNNHHYSTQYPINPHLNQTNHHYQTQPMQYHQTPQRHSLNQPLPSLSSQENTYQPHCSRQQLHHDEYPNPLQANPSPSNSLCEPLEQSRNQSQYSPQQRYSCHLEVSPSRQREASTKHQVRTYLEYKSYRRVVKGPTTYQSFLKFMETGSDDPDFLKKYNKKKSNQRRKKQRVQRSLTNKNQKEERLKNSIATSTCIDSLCDELKKSI